MIETTDKVLPVNRDIIMRFLAHELNLKIPDYCPNGLQIEGIAQIRHVVSGVTASQALIEKAIELDADMLLVHHGYFWRGENAAITGMKYRRIKLLLEHNINLVAYHLPLDMHSEIGNNAQLGKVLGLIPENHFGEHDLGWIGTLKDQSIVTVGQLAEHVEQILGRKPLLIGDASQIVSRVGWCTGAAQDLLMDAAIAGATVYLSGEISEQTVHEARECGVAYLACGHHATERYGIQALGCLLANKYHLKHTFVDINNPV